MRKKIRLRPRPAERYKHRPRLTHEGRRAIAKLLVRGVSSKQIVADHNVSMFTVFRIRRDYVITVLSERYPDNPEQMSLGLPFVPQASTEA